MSPYPRGIGRETAERDPLSLAFPLPRSRIPLPTFDLYRPLSIFCNLLLRILNVRIERVKKEGGRERGGLARWPRATNATRSNETRVRREEATVASRSQSRRVVPYYHPVGRCRPNLPSHLQPDDLLLSLSVRVTVSSFHRFYLLRYLLAQLPSRWCLVSLSLSLTRARWLPRGPWCRDTISTICTPVDR